MTRKLLALGVAALLLNLVCMTTSAASPRQDKDEQLAVKVKAAILKLGVGPAAHIEVKLRDGVKLKGYVLAADDDRFVVVNEKDGTSRDVAYPQVKQVRGHNLSTGAKVAIGVGIAVGVLLLILVVIAPRVIGS